MNKEFGFSGDIIRAAWKRQRGLCAKCGIKLVAANRDKGSVGAWHAHPRFVRLGCELEDNCVLLCINPPNNCHRSFGHGGLADRFYRHLEDRALPFLYAGTRRKHPSREFTKSLQIDREIHRPEYR